ncbi:tetratricopeptide repeat protein [Novosphingobium aerophilum]|nr:tetratricopeptide repeat protein [Novosphingobium aerophilum]
MMPKLARSRPLRGLSFVALLVSAAPAVLAQSAPADPEARLRKLEAEVRALQRQVFPGSDGKFFTPQVTPGAAAAPGTPAIPTTTPVTDLLTRMDSVEMQIARLTAQSEETANRVAQIEARLAALTPPAPAPGTDAPAGTPEAAAPGISLPLPRPAVSAPASTPAPALAAPAPTRPSATAPAPAPTAVLPAAPSPAAVKPAGTKPAPAKPTPAKPAVAEKPSPQRVAAVAKIVKPDTGNAGDDEYSYGFRLWEAKFYPEAQQQLRLYVDKYPRDAKISYGRNLLGRAFLDDGKPRDAAPWFLKNYQADKKGARAAESLLYLAESMRQLGDINRACIALGEFADTYPGDTSGRLKTLYDATRKAVTCE